MPPTILLIERLLSFSGLNSPFVLIESDAFCQSPLPLVDVFALRARRRNLRVAWLDFASGFASTHCASSEDAVLRVRANELFDDSAIESIASQLRTVINESGDDTTRPSNVRKLYNGAVIFIDSLTTLCSNKKPRALILPLLMKLLQLQQDIKSLTLVVCCDTGLLNDLDDLPGLRQSLEYMATTVLRISSFEHEIARHQAEQRSRVALMVADMAAEGVLQPLGSNDCALAIEVEQRRPSGRSVIDSCCLKNGQFVSRDAIDQFKIIPAVAPASQSDDPEKLFKGMTFDLGLSEKQRIDRENVELPHYKQQVLQQQQAEIYPPSVRNDGLEPEINYTLGPEDDYDDEDVDDDLLL